jgi:hypothetical protein
MIHDPKKIVVQGRIILLGQLAIWSYIIYLLITHL